MNVAILVGGRGGRIGREKGFLRLCGKTFVEILAERFSGCDLFFVCRNEEQAKVYSEFGEVVVDCVRDFGPLAGICSALRRCSNKILVLAVDMPLVMREIAEELYKRCIEADAVVPVWDDGKLEPLLACYSKSALSVIEKCIEMGERRVHKAIRMMKTIYYPVEKLRKFDPELISFFNVNSVEDYERLLKVVGCSSTDTEG